jgi:hypothetical protein
MKKIIVIALALVAGVVAPVHAESTPTIAIIDNGTNTALFGDKIAYEVCMVSMTSCPNGQKTMEGTGAANLPATKNKDFNHGTQMLSLVLRFNPNVKVIPIRIVGMTPAGNPGLYNLDDVNKAFDWVIANRVKFNIAAVSLSQGAVLPNCRVPAGMADKIAALKSFNVPVMAAAGNNSDRTAVFSPACLPDTVSVGATDNPWPGVQPFEYDPKAAPYIARYSNGATGQVDFYVNGRWNATMLDGTTKFTVGTSNSTAVMAAWWVLNRKASFDETFNYLMSTTVDAKNEWVTGRYIPVA